MEAELNEKLLTIFGLWKPHKAVISGNSWEGISSVINVDCHLILYQLYWFHCLKVNFVGSFCHPVRMTQYFMVNDISYKK